MRSEEEFQLRMTSIFHELRNPVTLLSSYMQLLAAGHPEICSYAHWEKMEQELNHLKTLLEDLSAWQGGAELRLTLLQPKEWFERYRERICAGALAADGSSKRSPEETPSFLLQADAALPAVRADPDKLQMLMDNLIRNAAEASGKEPLCVSVRLLGRQGMLLIYVKDNGPGIPPKQQASVFEPFVTFKKDGTGLGLSICRKIAEAHGGSISYDAPLDGGAGFLIRLPAENRPGSRPDAHNYPHPRP